MRREYFWVWDESQPEKKVRLDNLQLTMFMLTFPHGETTYMVYDERYGHTRKVTVGTTSVGYPEVIEGTPKAKYDFTKTFDREQFLKQTDEEHPKVETVEEAVAYVETVQEYMVACYWLSTIESDLWCKFGGHRIDDDELAAEIRKAIQVVIDRVVAGIVGT